MANFAAVISHVRRLLGQHASVSPDGELLSRFAKENDQDAFATLVNRHGPMVFRACQRVLKSQQDTEDAVQATFVILARKAGNLGSVHSLAAWLHTVATNTALNAQATNRRRRERQVEAMPEPESSDAAWGEISGVLDEELENLPAKYRSPLVLCYLEEKTHEEAGQELGCSKKTIQRRLEEARELLRGRLTRQGITLASGVLGTVLAENASKGAVPSALLTSTANIAGQGATGVLSASVTALVQQGVRQMFFAKMRVAAAILVAVLGLGVGVGAFTHAVLAGKDGDKTAAPGNEKSKEAAKKKDKPTAEEQANEKERAKLEGTWQVVGLEHDGDQGPAEVIAASKFIFQGNKLNMRVGNVVHEYTNAIDPTKEPKALDVAPTSGPEKGETLAWIYSLEGDKLRICGAESKESAAAPPLNPPPGGKPANPPAVQAKKKPPRPTELTAKAGSNQYMYVLKRIDAGQGKTDPPGVPLELKLVAKKKTYTLDLGGKTREEFKNQIVKAKGKLPPHAYQDPKASDDYPPLPEVDLALEIKNNSREDMMFWDLKSGQTELVFRLEGPGVVKEETHVKSDRAAYDSPVNRKLKAGESVSIPIKSLATHYPYGLYRFMYFTEPGEYTLVAELSTAVSPHPLKEGATFGGKPVPNFGVAILTSNPVKLNVVDPKDPKDPKGKTDSPRVPLELKLVAKKDTYTLDLGGKSEQEFADHVEALSKVRMFRKLPALPGIEVAVELHNTGDKELAFDKQRVGDFVLELQGPKAIKCQCDGPQGVHFQLPTELASGGSHAGQISKLSFEQRDETRKGRGTRCWYWAAAGEYTLTASCLVTVSGKRFTLASKPIKLKVEAKK